MRLIKNPNIPHWKQFNNGIVVDSGESIVLDYYPTTKPYISYRGCNYLYLEKTVAAEGIELDKWKI